jgi:hypothetical protein
MAFPPPPELLEQLGIEPKCTCAARGHAADRADRCPHRTSALRPLPRDNPDPVKENQMRDVATATLSGNLTRDAELRELLSGAEVARLRVATTTRRRNGRSCSRAAARGPAPEIARATARPPARPSRALPSVPARRAKRRRAARTCRSEQTRRERVPPTSGMGGTRRVSCGTRDRFLFFAVVVDPARLVGMCRVKSAEQRGRKVTSLSRNGGWRVASVRHAAARFPLRRTCDPGARHGPPNLLSVAPGPTATGRNPATRLVTGEIGVDG